MPRNFSQRGVRTSRRTNWLARTSLAHTALAAGTAAVIELLDASDSSEELANYVSPTLTRVRGKVLIDANVNPASATNNAMAGVCLYVSESSGVITSFAQAGLTLDNVIFSDIHGMSCDSATVAGTESNDLQMTVAFPYLEFNLDIKAQRKFHDANKLVLLIHNLSVDSSVAIAYNYAIRMLIKE